MKNAVVEFGAWALGRRRRFRVTGRSMLPTLSPGSFVLIDPDGEPVAGDLVVAIHPEKGIEIAKRVAAIDDVGVSLASDNPAEGSDSRQFGPVDPAKIAGVVTFISKSSTSRANRNTP